MEAVARRLMTQSNSQRYLRGGGGGGSTSGNGLSLDGQGADNSISLVTVAVEPAPTFPSHYGAPPLEGSELIGKPYIIILLYDWENKSASQQQHNNNNLLARGGFDV